MAFRNSTSSAPGAAAARRRPTSTQQASPSPSPSPLLLLLPAQTSLLCAGRRHRVFSRLANDAGGKGRSERRGACSALSAVAAAAAATSSFSSSSSSSSGGVDDGGEREGCSSPPLEPLPDSVFKMIRERGGVPFATASHVKEITSSSAFFTLHVTLEAAFSLFDHLLPPSEEVEGLKGKALAEVLLSFWEERGERGRREGKLTLWSTWLEVATAPSSGDVFRVKLVAKRHRDGIEFDLTANWSKVIRALGARVVGSKIRLERYDGGDGGGGGEVRGAQKGSSDTKRPPPLFVASAAFVPVTPRLSEGELALAQRIANRKARRMAPAPVIPPYEARPERIRKLAEATAAVALGKGGGDGSVPSCLVTVSCPSNFSDVRLPLQKAMRLLEPLLPESTRGLKGAALVAAFRAAGEKPGGGKSGKRIAWSRTVHFLEGARAEKIFPIKLGATLINNGCAMLGLSCGFHELVRALDGRQLGSQISFERFCEGDGKEPVLVATKLAMRATIRSGDDLTSESLARQAEAAARVSSSPHSLGARYAPRVLEMIAARGGVVAGGKLRPAASVTKTLSNKKSDFSVLILPIKTALRFFELELPPGARGRRGAVLGRALRSAAECENDDERENSKDVPDLGEKMLWHCVVNVVEALRGETIPVQAVAFPIRQFAEFCLTVGYHDLTLALFGPERERQLGAKIVIEMFEDPSRRDLDPPLFVASRVG